MKPLAATPTTPPADAAAPTRSPKAPAPGEKIPSHYHVCFGCGPDHATGLRLELTAGEGTEIQAGLRVGEAHQGAPGLAHGGLLACALDEVLGATVGWMLGAPAVTARLETDFLTPVPVGAELFISARCLGVAGRKVYLAAEGRLGGEDGPLAVRACALFVVVDLEHFTTHGRRQEVEGALSDPDLAGARRALGLNP